MGRQKYGARTKKRDWSTREVETLEALLPTMSLKDLARRLGRTKRAIRLKAHRLGLSKRGEGYTARTLAQALGMSDNWVTCRIKSGRLRATRRNTERTSLQNGDYYYITDDAFLAFLLEYPNEVNLRKLDQVWFIDLIVTALRRAR